MKTVAVICEFNPFHEGHALLFRRIREIEGADAAILCVMSGAFVERGEAAAFPKTVRAAAAVEAGADLVVELPFPFSCSSAERFARAGTHIAAALGADVLAFGSECGDLTALSETADLLESPAFRAAEAAETDSSSVGCAAKTEHILRALGAPQKTVALLRQPNDLLAVEYLRAIRRGGFSLAPLAVRREGDAHGETAPGASMSSAAIRRLLRKEKTAKIALSSLPSTVSLLFENAISEGKWTADPQILVDQLFFYYRFCDRDALLACDGLSGGLGDRILTCARRAANAETFFALLRTKKFTDAHLRRALLYGFFSVTREQLNEPPAYTQVLAMNDTGRRLLAAQRKNTAISLLTKPADHRALTGAAARQAALSLRADVLFGAGLATPSAAADAPRYAPYRKECREKTTG